MEIVDGVVIWKNGTWKSGIWEGGVWENGTWEGGVWEGGVWENGTWEGGVWEGGVWRGDVWHAGEIYESDCSLCTELPRPMPQSVLSIPEKPITFKELLGSLPADESDEEVIKALEEMS